MPYTAKAVANSFLDIARGQGVTIDPMKIQKLVYFAHGWYLALRDESLIVESVVAWPQGPVIPVLYHEFKRWGSGAILESATSLDGAGRALIVPSLESECVWEASPDAALKVIGRVWSVYGKFSGLQLSTMTHQPGTPWAQIREKYPHKRDVAIPDDDIKAFFKAELQNARPAVATETV